MSERVETAKPHVRVIQRATRVGMMLSIPPISSPRYRWKRFGWVLRQCQGIRNITSLMLNSLNRHAF